MNRLSSREDLASIRKQSEDRIAGIKCRILICAGTGCLAGGSQKIYEKMCELCGTSPDAEIVFGPEAAHADTDIQKSGFCLVVIVHNNRNCGRNRKTRKNNPKDWERISIFREKPRDELY